MASKITEELLLHSYAGAPYVYLETPEEDRVVSAIQNEIIGEDGESGDLKKEKIVLYTWSLANGLYKVSSVNPPSVGMWPKDNPNGVQAFKGTTQFHTALDQFLNEELPNEKAVAILIAQDLPLHFDGPAKNPIWIRALKDAATAVSNRRRMVVMVSGQRCIPPELERTIKMVNIPFPSKEELHNVLVNEVIENVKEQKKDDPKGCGDLKVKYNDSEIWEIASAGTGMISYDFIMACNLSLARKKEICPDLIASAKQDIVKKSGALEYLKLPGTMNDVGGLDLLKEYLRKRKAAFTKEAQDFGVEVPKGVILLGYAGCGKSLVAKMLGQEWNLPVIRLDMGAIYGSLVGASESNVRHAISIIEAASPCIVFIDELEKGMAGIGSSNVTDGGTSARVFGTLLSWLQDKTCPAYVIGTCNNVNSLPPEILRKGRFDEIFWVSLPGPESVKEILSIHLRKRDRDPEDFDLEKLSKIVYRSKDGKKYLYSGSEWEEAVKASILNAYDKQKDVDTEDIEEAISEIIPLGYLKNEEMDAAQKIWADRSRSASSTDKKPVSKTKVAGKDDLSLSRRKTGPSIRA
jgi:ATP-dependent 26S proteasome regulatory subunit